MALIVYKNLVSYGLSFLILDVACPQDIRRGLNLVNRVRSMDHSGIYGSILELLSCDEKYFTAVEVTAGNRYADSILWR